jgi:hypothetical protein
VLTIQYDGHNGSNVFHVVDDDSMQLLDAHLLRTPYVLLSSPRVMVIGVGGGIDVLNAIRRGAARDSGMISVVMGDQSSLKRSVSMPTVTRLAMIAREALARRGVADPAPARHRTNRR